MFISLGVGLHAQDAPSGETLVVTTTLSVSDFSRDRTLFDSGVAVGRDAAMVPVSGMNTPGEIVEYRLLPDSGAPTPWVALGGSDGSGTWSASISVPKSNNWLRFEVRNQSEPYVRAMTSHRFGVGHVIALWGQSEIVRLRTTTYDTLQPEPLLDGDSVQAMWMDGGTPVVEHLSDANPQTSALAAFANVLMAEQPGDKFAIVFQAVAGTGLRALVDDTDASRSWSEDAALHAFATADGQSVGLPAMSWFASPGSVAGTYEEAFLPLFTGKLIDGSSVTFPAAITHGASSYQADHWFGELYDPADTRWIAYGPHRFDITEDMANATQTALGGSQANMVNKQAARESWRALIENPIAAGYFLPLGLEPLTYVNGRDDGLGSWTDMSHPAGNTDDGAPNLARLTAHAILQSAGFSSWSVPEFDASHWEPDGSYVELWTSAGSITTIRQARDEPALSETFPHWTNVLGWQINGQPAERVELVNGRVRVYPNNAAFVAGDVLNFGEGGASGMIKFPEDAQNATYKDLPIVDVGAHGLEGVPLRPLPDVSVLANPLVPTNTSFVTTAAGPWFEDPNTLGSGVSAIQFSMKMAISVPTSGARTLFATTGNYLRLEVLPNRAMRLRVRDNGGTVHLDGVATSSGLVSDGVTHKIVVSIDLSAGYARIWLDDVLVIDETFVSATPELPSNRILSLLATFGGSYQTEGTVYFAKIWYAATSDGSDPTVSAHKIVEGAASAINLDAWKKGSNAT